MNKIYRIIGATLLLCPLCFVSCDNGEKHYHQLEVVGVSVESDFESHTVDNRRDIKSKRYIVVAINCGGKVEFLREEPEWITIIEDKKSFLNYECHKEGCYGGDFKGSLWNWSLLKNELHLTREMLDKVSQ